MRVRIDPAPLGAPEERKLRGEVPIPGSKSHTIRGLIIAALAAGESLLRRPLRSGDTVSCINACRALGAEIAEEKDPATGEDLLRVRGRGGTFASGRTICLGNSGTSLYLLASVVALGEVEYTLTGDDQLRSRPAGPLIDSLSDLGAKTEAIGQEGTPPLRIRGPLTGGSTSIECPTSQYLSSLLLAAPLAGGDSQINVPLLMERPYVEMTLRWLDEQGIRYEQEDFNFFRIYGGQHYSAFERAVPGDFSSATFFLVATAITGSELHLKGLDMTDSQGDKAVVSMLISMGCTAEALSDGIIFRGPEKNDPFPLIAREFDLNDTPDALPAMAVACCFARGTSKLYNVSQARLKETDRITVTREELTKMGARIEETDDGLIIRGGDPDFGAETQAKMRERENPAEGIPVASFVAEELEHLFPLDGPFHPSPPLHGAELDSRGDHRMVMALSVAALAAEGVTVIEGAEAAEITFPGFFPLLRSILSGGNSEEASVIEEEGP